MSEFSLPAAFRELPEPHRYKVYYGGRGGGKSWAFATVLLARAKGEPIRVLCTREFQNSIKDSVHRILADQITNLGWSGSFRVTDKGIYSNAGAEFIFEGVRRNVQSIKSKEGIDICWVEEAQTVTDESWDVIIPTIRKPGSEIWVSFNTGAKGDPTYQRFVQKPPKNAIVRKVGYQDNPWFPEELAEERDHLKELDYDRYLNIWEGEIRTFAEGAIYAKQLRKLREDGHICLIDHQPGVEVNTFWDLGKGDKTAIWFHQRVGKEDRFIDYYENRLKDLAHYIKFVKDQDYNYGDHYLPHDVEHDLLGMERTRKQQLEEGGITPITVVPRIRDINEGIEMTRHVLPLSWFDNRTWTDEEGNEQGVGRGLECLQNYRYEYDEDRGVYRPQPLHNWASDGADAFRQFAQGYSGPQHWEPLNMNTKWVV